MNQRLTTPSKWQDAWFLSLTPAQKLLFCYIIDNCDDAGFFEAHFPTIAMKLGLNEGVVSASFKGINRCYVSHSTEPNKIWVKNFLKHQNRLPLSANDKEDKLICARLIDQINNGFLHPDLSNIITGITRTKKGGVKKEFKPPTIEDFTNYATQKGMNLMEAENLFHYYQKVGWTVGASKKPMVSWESAISQALSRAKIRMNEANQQGSSRFDKLSKISKNTHG